MIMNIPENLLYTKDHEWISIENDIATVGITDYAQSELGDIIFIEFPSIEDKLIPGEAFGTIEAVKTVADLFSPIKGKVVEINDKLEDSPELTNNDPYGDGWIIKIKIEEQNEENLLSHIDYGKII
tara:strand:- start:629 stop:1006 length:378 start_codon:yes stop_codon:yes gene_type:complete